MIEMIVDSVRMSVASYQRVVVLKEKLDAVERYLLIWVGNSEAGSIAMALQGMEPPRPLSHDLMQAMLHKFGGKVTQVLINNLVEDTYYARITIEGKDHTFVLDARPSDAIALALRAKAPIYAERIVLDTAGIVPDESAQGEGDNERLAIFRDFVNTLDLTGLSGDPA
jgi:uncharacterized protein